MVGYLRLQRTETRGLYSGALGFFALAAQDVVVGKVRELARTAGRELPAGPDLRK